MRYIPLLLSAALFAFAPALAQAADAAKAPAAAPAATTVPVAAAPASAAAPAPADLFSDNQRAEIESIIKDYLTKKNPEVLMEAMQELQKRQTADSDAKSKAALSSDRDKVYNDPSTPVGGNPKGAVTVVEFFDYQCGYCKMSEPSVEKLLKEEKDVKFIYKEYPILGPSSTMASKAALASMKQDKYAKFHDALMAAQFSHGANPKADEETIYKVAKEVGLDVDKLKKDMADPALDKIVEANVALGQEVGARGTPTFIINEQIYPGAMQYDEIKKSVDDARAAAAKKP